MSTYVTSYEDRLVFDNGTTFMRSDAQEAFNQLPPSPNRYLHEHVEGLISGIASGVAPKLRGSSKVRLDFGYAVFSRANARDVIGKISLENTFLRERWQHLLDAMDAQAGAEPIRRRSSAGLPKPSRRGSAGR